MLTYNAHPPRQPPGIDADAVGGTAVCMSDTPLKVIAGAPDRPLRIGDIEVQCYVLEDETRVLSQRGVYEALDVRVRHRIKRVV